MELIILKLLFNSKFYNDYYNSIDSSFIKKNSKQLEKLYTCLEEYHSKYPDKDIKSVDEFITFFYSLYPSVSNKDKELLEPLFKKLEVTTVTENVAESFLKEQRKRAKAAQLALLGLKVSEGQEDFGVLIEESKELEKIDQQGNGEYPFVMDDETEGRPPIGLRWPLKTLNEMLGSLRKGNFGFIFARPETGKTTFLAHFATHCLMQLGDGSGPILWFNNEQPGLEVLHRCIASYFGITSQEFYLNKKKYSQQYYAETENQLKIVDEAALYKKDVEFLCRKYRPSLIIFDQIDKIKGFSDDRNDLELKAIYQWARELAKEYGPVIGVCQAGASGEGKKWLTMDDVDSSKTSKQGEADWILGIGKSNQDGMESIRHLHLCKNKLLGDEDTIPKLRHGKADVLIHADIARYGDIPR